ncbi:Uma2 family endonuclease [Tumidithrix elongata RA019]|uniref:Uma2 family endonuclease n=1 Tax=Tumidithrix elongata BACA0141 TaxID=2716417 RepID=A0AAW9PTY4_9CYAN|nr:Uma2 family endonuclease [Tumidithrix elongata RA019]
MTLDQKISENSSQNTLEQNPDRWVKTSWDDFLKSINQPKYEKAKCYYYKGEARVETMPTGSDHANDHALLLIAIGLFVAVKGLVLNGKDNCSYRKVDTAEVQPDISYYVGDRAQLIPWGTGVVDLDIYPAPDLAIEIANSSWADDVGKKRLIYEDLGVKEYWVIDVRNAEILAFAIAETESGKGSYRIERSQVIADLEISLLAETLRMSRQQDQGQVTAWLLTQLQQKS